MNAKCVLSGATSPKDAFVLPFEFGRVEKDYTGRLLAGPLRDRSTITVIVRHSFDGPNWVNWLSQVLANAGFSKKRSAAYGEVDVLVFQRS